MAHYGQPASNTALKIQYVSCKMAPWGRGIGRPDGWKEPEVTMLFLTKVKYRKGCQNLRDLYVCVREHLKGWKYVKSILFPLSCSITSSRICLSVLKPFIWSKETHPCCSNPLVEKLRFLTHGALTHGALLHFCFANTTFLLRQSGQTGV